MPDFQSSAIDHSSRVRALEGRIVEEVVQSDTQKCVHLKELKPALARPSGPRAPRPASAATNHRNAVPKAAPHFAPQTMSKPQRFALPAQTPSTPPPSSQVAQPRPTVHTQRPAANRRTPHLAFDSLFDQTRYQGTRACQARLPMVNLFNTASVAPFEQLVGHLEANDWTIDREEGVELLHTGFHGKRCEFRCAAAITRQPSVVQFVSVFPMVIPADKLGTVCEFCARANWV